MISARSKSVNVTYSRTKVALSSVLIVNPLCPGVFVFFYPCYDAVMIQPLELGTFRLYPLLDGFFRLDGGPLFGVVPRQFWSRLLPPDERNRVRLSMRPLLVEAQGQWILIDTGIGDKFDAKWIEIYGIERTPSLEEQLAEVGISKADIKIVINTHLHWDHAGGNTIRNREGQWAPAFPNARYVIQRGEFEFATHLNERTRGSYRPDDYEALEKLGLFDFADGDKTILPGVRVVRSGGHVPYHHCVLLESGKNRAFFLGDLIPTHHHLPVAYIMGFDLEPLTTLARKKEYLARAAEEDWLLFFVHDPELACGTLDKQATQFALKERRNS